MIVLLLRRYIAHHPRFRYKRWKWFDEQKESAMHQTKILVTDDHRSFTRRQRIEAYFLQMLIQINKTFDRPIVYSLYIIAAYRVIKRLLYTNIPVSVNHVTKLISSFNLRNKLMNFKEKKKGNQPKL